MALATRCPFCKTTFRVVEDQLKLCNGIVRCGSCQQIFNGSEQLIKPEDIDPTLEVMLAADSDAEPDLGPGIATVDEVIPEADVQEEPDSLDWHDDDNAAHSDIPKEPNFDIDSFTEVVEADLDLVLEPSPNFRETTGVADRVEVASSIEERDFADWQTYDSPAEDESSIDLDLGADIKEEPILDAEEELGQFEHEPVEEPVALASEIEAELVKDAYEVSLSTSTPQSEEDEDTVMASDSVITEEVEPDFMKQVRRQERFGSMWRNLMLVGVLVLPLILLMQTVGAFHNRILTSFPSLKPALEKVCSVMDCRTELPRQIDKIVVEHSELLAVDKSKNRYALNVLLSNRSGVAQTWPNLELTLNDENGRPVARRVFMPVDYLNNVNEKTQGVSANSEKSVRLVFELDKLNAAGYLVHVFYI